MVDIDKRRSDLIDLMLADRESGGHPGLPEGSREGLTQILEQALVNRDALAGHIRELQQLHAQFQQEYHHTDTLSEGDTERVLSQGLSVLDDRILAGLLLNPVALHCLSEEIDERLPEAWLEAMEQDGQALLRDHGRTVSPVEDLVEIPRRRIAVGVLGEGADQEQGKTPTRRWVFERTPEDCTWQTGDPSLAGGRGAKITAEWHDGDHLEVGVSGFLRLGRGYSLQVSWEAKDGTVRAEGRISDELSSVRLDTADKRGPNAGDRLHVRHTQRAQGGSGWDISLSVEF